jgi:hypothetical protein
MHYLLPETSHETRQNSSEGVCTVPRNFQHAGFFSPASTLTLPLEIEGEPMAKAGGGG